MKAASDDQLRLLDLQGLDLTIDRLGHRRSTLPELATIETLTGRANELDDDIVRAETQDSDLGREQAKIDVDVETVRSRMDRDQARLDSGQVGAARELENLQSEIQSLHKRQSDLEDAELEVMEQRETVQTELTKLHTELETVNADLGVAQQGKDAAEAEIAAELTSTRAERVQMATTIPEDLLALYEKLRASSGGIGAARLHRGRCEGCHLQLNTTELNELRDAPSDDVARCEECRRILVRTDESGL